MPGQAVFKDSPAAIAVAYGRIAKGLRRVGEVSLALNVCEKGLERYPNNSSIYITKGEIQIACYNIDSKANHLKEALVNFDKALKLDPQNYLAKLLASQIYLKAGARNQAKALLSSILKTSPDDPRAKAMMVFIKEKDKTGEGKAPKGEAKAAAPSKTQPPTEKPTDERAEHDKADLLDKTEADQWELDEKVEIGEEDEPLDDLIVDMLSAKLSIFSRLEGLAGIFVIDRNGQPIKIINKGNLDENIVPSFIFNLFKASTEGVRRSGLGAFHQGVLVSPIGTIVLAEVPHATIAVVVDDDANIGTVEKRILRYQEEVKG